MSQKQIRVGGWRALLIGVGALCAYLQACVASEGGSGAAGQAGAAQGHAGASGSQSCGAAGSSGDEARSQAGVGGDGGEAGVATTDTGGASFGDGGEAGVAATDTGGAGLGESGGTGGADASDAGSGGSGGTSDCRLRCEPKSLLPCVSTSTDCDSGFRCAAGSCVAGPVAGQPAVNGVACAHGFYVNASTNQLCQARAQKNTIHCVPEDGSAGNDGPYCLENLRCVFRQSTIAFYCVDPTTDVANQYCASQADCGTAYECVVDPLDHRNKCIAPIALGSFCDPAVFAGHCVAGSYCLFHTPADGFPALCASYPTLGQACSGGNCAAGLTCAVGICSTPPPPAGLGEACSANTCGAGLACIAADEHGTCTLTP